jgi:hypothetical protein
MYPFLFYTDMLKILFSVTIFIIDLGSYFGLCKVFLATESRCLPFCDTCNISVLYSVDLRMSSIQQMLGNCRVNSFGFEGQ